MTKVEDRGVGRALMVAGAAAYGAAFPPLEIHGLAWLAPVLWLMALKGQTATTRFGRMFGAGYIGTVAVVYWLTALFSTLALVLWVVPALYLGVWGLAVGWFAIAPLWVRVVWPAVAWVGVEYVRCELAPLAFSFGTLGASQPNMVGFSVASVVGVYGVSAVMVTLGALAVEKWKQGVVPWRQPALGAVVLAGLAAFIPQMRAKDGQTRGAVGVAVLQQLKQSDDMGSWDEMPVRGGGRKPDLIVWPEFTFADDPRLPHASWFMEMMREDAAQTKRGVMFGAINYYTEEKTRQGPYYNSTFLLSPTGEVAGMAGKNQPVHLMNDGLPAPDVVVMDLPSAGEAGILKAGVGVCYDGCFQRYSQRMTARGAEFLVFPTMNIEAWGPNQHRQHQRLFQMRAAETGRTVLVAAVSGPTFAARPGGAAGEVLPFHTTGNVGAEIARPKQTLFNMGGWLFGPVCVALFAAGTVVSAGMGFRWLFGGGERKMCHNNILH